MTERCVTLLLAGGIVNAGVRQSLEAGELASAIEKLKKITTIEGGFELSPDETEKFSQGGSLPEMAERFLKPAEKG